MTQGPSQLRAALGAAQSRGALRVRDAAFSGSFSPRAQQSPAVFPAWSKVQPEAGLPGCRVQEAPSALHSRSVGGCYDLNGSAVLLGCGEPGLPGPERENWRVEVEDAARNILSSSPWRKIAEASRALACTDL